MRAFPYASSVDALAHLSLAATFTATSRPNATQVYGHLLTASDELDAALVQAKYSTPIATGATAASELLRAWGGIGGALYTAQSHPAGQDSKHAAFLERRWNAILDGIRDGKLTLPGIDKDASVALPRFATSSGDGAGASPYFGRSFPQGV